MSWIQSHTALSDHPKTRKLARILGTSKPTTIGHLHCLWWWAFDYAADGSLDRFDAMDIAIAAEWDGEPDDLVSALVTAGFLDRDEDGLTLHDWDQYGGKLHAKRAADADRKRAERRGDKGGNPSPSNGCPSDIQYPSHVEKKREEEKREEENNNGADAPPKAKRASQVPQDFAVTEALESWGKANGFTVEQMTSQIPEFIDHYQAKGEARKDWNASFHNWMRRAKKWNQLDGQRPGGLRIFEGGYDPLRTMTPKEKSEFEAQMERAKREQDALLPPEMRAS